MTAVATRWVYDFADGDRSMRTLLGGKGAGLAEMTRVLGPELVPAGFTITTEACMATLRGGTVPDGLTEQVDAALARLESLAGRRFGDPAAPLLLSVRSGARDSMPGMMDTVLNLGLTDASVEGLAARAGDHFAWDAYRRLLQMFGNVVRGVPGERFEALLAEARAAFDVRTDAELPVEGLQGLVHAFKPLAGLPADPREQLDAAIGAVFSSWNGDRAIEYRRINHLPDDWGTAVNVQQMVFGNLGPTSGSGVAFSRDEITGGPEPSGDFLVDAQGEDVVSGVRTPRDLSELDAWQPGLHADLVAILRRLEAHYGDMQDTEFTVEDGRLYMLQTRTAKRPAQAAVRFAVDAVAEGLLSRGRAIATIDASALEALLHPGFDPRFPYHVVARGVAASPGAAKGEIAFTAPAAVDAAMHGRDVILVRPFTEADDVAGFHAATGILTSEGGKASHAALVARGMGRPAVTGAAAVHVDLREGIVRIGEHELHSGDRIAIDGSTGAVSLDDVPLVPAVVDAHFDTVLRWCDELRAIGVRANADTPADARRARELGAEGIGLCRTEHMFMAADRQPLMRRMVMAETEAERRAALDALLPLQQGDFAGLFEAMRGLPVTIRLLDPPLHEFLPDHDVVAEAVVRAELGGAGDLPALRAQLDRVRELEEANPMLGTRGVRLGLLHPEVYEMQVRAIARAARSTEDPPRLEVMVPLVGYTGELHLMRANVIRWAAAEGLRYPEDFTVGTMVELPRACLGAGRLARDADFFSFGTNDLTQTAIGLSRDDTEGTILRDYERLGIIDRSPFESIDEVGVGELVRMAVERGRAARPGLELGVCGEHGGDPRSIAFFARTGLDYVSCSPFRVPIARVAAAQAALAA